MNAEWKLRTVLLIHTTNIKQSYLPRPQEQKVVVITSPADPAVNDVMKATSPYKSNCFAINFSSLKCNFRMHKFAILVLLLSSYRQVIITSILRHMDHASSQSTVTRL